MFKTSEFDFDLPEGLIAHKPFFPKEETKMLVYQNRDILDRQIINLVDFLNAGDVLVFNDARVIKAKLSAIILSNQAKLDFNLDQEKDGLWQALCRPAKKVKQGDELQIAEDFFATVAHKSDDGFIQLRFDCDGDLLQAKLEKYGAVPLPPYIKREQQNVHDQENYQTIYAASGTAVAAPTAGLHFTDKIFDLLEQKQVKKAFVTLNVGAGTFLPVRADNIADHKMHEEFFSISQETADMVNEAKANGKRVIAVGTTSLRSLESACDANGKLCATQTRTDIFIYPGYTFKIVDMLMTNFHLPKSTLFMLISAFVGKDEARKIYDYAIANRYRFYSYGDSSLLFKPKSVIGFV